MKKSLLERSSLFRALLSLFLLVAMTSNVWGQVTTATITEGKKYVITAYSNKKYYALPRVDGASTYSGTEVTLKSNNKVQFTNDLPVYQFTYNSNGGGYKVTYSYTNNGKTYSYNLFKSSTTNSGSTQYNIQGSSNTHYWKMTKTSDGKAYNAVAVNKGSYNTYLNYYSSEWQARGTSASTSGSNNTSIILIEVDEGTPSPTTYNINVDNDITGGTVSASATSATAGTTINISAEPSTGYTFTSWNVPGASVASSTSAKTSFTMPANDVTVSATFTKDQAPEVIGEYILKDISEIGKNDEVIITMTNSEGTTYAMSNDKGTSAAPSAVPVTVYQNTIANPDANILWNVSYSNSELTIYPNGVTNKNLYCINDANGVRVGNGEKDFVIEGSYLKHKYHSRYIGVYSNSDFRCYTSTSTNITGQTLAFYVKAGTPVTQTIPAPTFNPVAGTYTEAQSVTVTNYNSDYMYFYTTDGTAPDCDENLDATGTSLVFDNNAGITISENTTLKMIAVDIDCNKSDVTTAIYTINIPTPEKQPASFGYTVHAKVGSQFQGLTFSNNLDAEATYCSSDTDVATVDATTGKVAIVGAGTAIITYTVTGSDEVNTASQTYTIIVGE